MKLTFEHLQKRADRCLIEQRKFMLNKEYKKAKRCIDIWFKLICTMTQPTYFLDNISK